MAGNASQPAVAIAGGGLAGLAAACALADAGCRVTLFEQRPFLGGRASSYEHPGTNEVVDNCQHVFFRCCTNLVGFYERIGAADRIRWYDEMTFLEPGGRASRLYASPLPAPLQTMPAFLHFPFLTAGDKIALSRGISSLVVSPPRGDSRSFSEWARATGQTDAAMRLFWSPVLVSALNEDLDRISVFAAAKVVRDSMKSADARVMGIPSVPLTEIYNLAGEYIRARGGNIQQRTAVGQIVNGDRLTIRAAGGEDAYDYAIVALNYDAAARVLPDTPESESLRQKMAQFESSPITGIHLWFDREISDLDHAVLLDRTIQWMFHKSRILSRFAEQSQNAGSYVELVVSSSKALVEKSRAEIIDLALAELREFFPAARDANVVKSTVVKEIKATFSARPGIEEFRPDTATAWPRIFLAGDWTNTGWPATMEGAVRSGYKAADAVLRAASPGKPSFLVPDLPASGFMKLLA